VTPPNGNTTITTMAAAGGNGPLEPRRMPYVPLQRVVLIEDDPPSKRICFLWGLIGHMPLKMLRCCGGASSLEQRSVLRGIHPINPTPKHIRLLGGLSPINPTRRRTRLALEWDSRGPFPPAAIMVGLVVVCSAQPRTVLTGTLAYHTSLESSCK